MKPAHIAFGMVLLSLAMLAMAFLTGCAGGLGSPQVCLKTDYGTFCYALPEMPTPSTK